MSRFVNLEFGDEYEGQGHQSTPVKGEAYYLAEATAAFENGKFEPALRLYSKVLEFNPENVRGPYQPRAWLHGILQAR